MSNYTFAKHNQTYIKSSEELSDIAVSLYEQQKSEKDVYADGQLGALRSSREWLLWGEWATWPL